MTDPSASVSRDLAEIVTLEGALLTQAVARARDHDDAGLIGGDAMVNLGPVGNLEQGRNRQDAREDAYYQAWMDDVPATFPHPDHETADGEMPALQLLVLWSARMCDNLHLGNWAKVRPQWL